MKKRLHQFLHWHKYDWQETSDYTLNFADMSTVSPDYVLIGEVDVEVEVPDNFDPTPGRIEALRNEKRRIQAETEVKVNNLEEQIQNLLALDFKP